MTKVAGVLEGFAQTREFLTNMGFTPSEVTSIRSQLARAQGASIVAGVKTAQSAPADRPSSGGGRRRR